MIFGTEIFSKRKVLRALTIGCSVRPQASSTEVCRYTRTSVTDLSKDPVINAVHNGIKRGIRVALENKEIGARGKQRGLTPLKSDRTIASSSRDMLQPEFMRANSYRPLVLSQVSRLSPSLL